ncbi:hypothetical protein [Nonomuraea rosea]|uniref:hypothetical protein n=1 Tax=Nonomuraea rosea TaxID=638574 RepID=UPI0031F10389
MTLPPKHDRLVGVIVSAETGYAHRRLYVVPLAAALEASPALAAALQEVTGSPVVVQVYAAPAYRHALMQVSLEALRCGWPTSTIRACSASNASAWPMSGPTRPMCPAITTTTWSRRCERRTPSGGCC